ncbi:hypothetical protein [Hymenobacter sp. GOD-10R]|uniref:hypothetical protein n=1 Tax=Hymenobacter sp. GOD-10R TaxID=3093922 RepID=UPI002D77124A|nr:hypothetical protein [Hymenobacter sp. GOD-10R]WRQ26665.1 hypothetical protein SD425_16455 [Hymenobacter sp. GOD-10R]
MQLYNAYARNLANLQAVVPILTTEDGTPMPVVTQSDLDERTRRIIGQQTLPPQNWNMANNRSARRLDVVEAILADLAPQLALAIRKADAAQADADANELATQALEVRAAADDLADAALLAYAQATEAKATATQLALEANTLADAQDRAYAQATQSQVAALAAAQDLLKAQATANTQAIATAQAAANAAQAKADADEVLAKAAQVKAEQALTAAQAAQASANTAQASATTAISNAASAATAASAAQSTATAAQTSATAAQTAVAALADRFRSKRISTPAMLIGAEATINVVWDKPFTDNLYTMNKPELVGGSILGLAAQVTAHTAAGCTVKIKNTLGLQLAAGAATLEITALHD